jgi:hypothetical protein
MARAVKKQIIKFGFSLKVQVKDKGGQVFWQFLGTFPTKFQAEQFAKKSSHGTKFHIEGLRVDSTPVEGFVPREKAKAV